MTYVNMDDISRIGREAMILDRHTQMKDLGNVSYLKEEDPSQEGFRATLKNKRYVFIKAVNEDGEVVGGGSFYFQGFEHQDIPYTDPEIEEAVPAMKIEVHHEEPLDDEKKRANAMIDRLEEMEGEDMKRWQNILMPPGTKCIIVTGLSVDPKYHRRGIGSALMKWGTDKADERGVFMWVHSSEAAYKIYINSGFEVVGILVIDLDAWAPAPPPKEAGEDMIWGHYLCRYMKRLPKKSARRWLILYAVGW